jgi:hypothetical protein
MKRIATKMHTSHRNEIGQSEFPSVCFVLFVAINYEL